MVKKKFASAAMQTKHIFFLALRREGGVQGRFGLAFRFRSSDLDKIWHGHTT